MLFDEEDEGFPEKYRKFVECKGCRNWFHVTCEMILNIGVFRGVAQSVFNNESVCAKIHLSAHIFLLNLLTVHKKLKYKNISAVRRAI